MTLSTRRLRRAAASLVAAGALVVVTACGGGGADGDFPTRPVELVNPWAAGGSHDAHARAISSEIQDALGQPMTVSIKDGGAGAVGATAVARQARPDGYTLLLGDQTSVIARPLAEQLEYAWDDFRPVAQINASPIVLTVPEDSPFDTIDEFLDAAQADPGGLNYGSVTGLGPDQIPVELMLQQTGTELTHIPFEGGGPSYRAVLAGEIDLAPLFPAAVTQDIREGRLKALAVTSPERIDSMPDVPTLMESGIDVDWQMFRTVFAPVETPDEVVDALVEAFEELAQSQGFLDIIEGLGEEVELLTGDELQERFETDAAALESLVDSMR